MIQRNFILTDIMKTGDHRSYEQFITTSSIEGQHFEYTGEYYTLHNYDLDVYNRKFALIDMRIHNDRVVDNIFYKKDLITRLQFLYEMGFKFILSNPWESKDNLRSQIFHNGKRLKKLDIPFDYYTWTGGTSWFWNYMYHKHKKNRFYFNHSNKKYNFLYLNKFPRKHRLKLYKKLQDSQLLKKTLYTFLGLDAPIRLSADYELPWCKPNDYPKWGLDQDLYEIPYNDTGCSLVSETNDVNDEIFMTEKIWKPIIAKHIFIVHGNLFYLKQLKNMGFKTFDNIINELYDAETDPNKRIELIVDVCKKLENADWKKLYNLTEDIREHNYKTFFNKDLLSKEINKEILSWLKFFDSSKISS